MRYIVSTKIMGLYIFYLLDCWWLNLGSVLEHITVNFSTSARALLVSLKKFGIKLYNALTVWHSVTSRLCITHWITVFWKTKSCSLLYSSISTRIYCDLIWKIFHILGCYSVVAWWSISLFFFSPPILHCVEITCNLCLLKSWDLNWTINFYHEQ